MKILLVEDHRDSAQVMAKFLGNRGFEVEIAADCKDAMRAFEEHHFDLLILDIRLPDGDSCDLLRVLAQIRAVKSIAISAYPLYEHFNRVRAAGFDRYLAKPFGAQAVYEIIDELFPSPICTAEENLSPIFLSSQDKVGSAMTLFAEGWLENLGVEPASALDPALASTSEPASELLRRPLRACERVETRE